MKLSTRDSGEAKAGQRVGKHSKLVSSILQRWQLYLMVLPALLYLILFCYKPMYGILIAFKDYNMKLGVTASPWAKPLFKNFSRLFNSYWFPIMLKNTLTISLLSLLLFPLPVILALLVNEIGNGKIRKLFQTVSYAPHFISVVVVVSMINLLLANGGLARLLEALGAPDNLMQSPTAFKWIYIISGEWQGIGWGSILYYATLSSVDKNLLEAAELDGANRFQRIIHVNLPALAPTIAIMFIMRCGQIMSVGYEKVYLMQNNLNLVGSEVISTYVYKVGLQEMEYSFSTAVGLFNSVINCILLVSVNKLSKKVSGSGLW